jgi:hypothetical protein
MAATRSAKSVNWPAYSISSLLGLVGVTVIAGVTGWWVLTAIPVVFCLGSFCRKATCGVLGVQ